MLCVIYARQPNYELNSPIFDATEKLRIEFPNLIAIQFIFDAPY